MEKKKYSQPIVELTQLLQSSSILTGSVTGIGIGGPSSGGVGGMPRRGTVIP